MLPGRAGAARRIVGAVTAGCGRRQLARHRTGHDRLRLRVSVSLLQLARPTWSRARGDIVPVSVSGRHARARGARAASGNGARGAPDLELATSDEGTDPSARRARFRVAGQDRHRAQTARRRYSDAYVASFVGSRGQRRARGDRRHDR